jgi:hypothetical protein
MLLHFFLDFSLRYDSLETASLRGYGSSKGEGLTIDGFQLTMERPRPTRHAVGDMTNQAQGSERCIVTDVVKLRKLTSDLINCFPHPSAEPVLQAWGLFEIEPVLRPFFRAKSCQILPFSAKTQQKTTEKQGFFATDLLNRVKSCGSRQAVIRLPVFPRTCSKCGRIQQKIECSRLSIRRASGAETSKTNPSDLRSWLSTR